MTNKNYGLATLGVLHMYLKTQMRLQEDSPFKNLDKFTPD